MKTFITFLLLVMISCTSMGNVGSQLMAKTKKRVSQNKALNTKNNNKKSVVVVKNTQQAQQPVENHAKSVLQKDLLQKDSIETISQQPVEKQKAAAADTTIATQTQSKVKITEKMICPDCYITPGKCIKCYGSGKMLSVNDVNTTYVVCTECHGTGICPTCNGSKMVEKK